MVKKSVKKTESKKKFTTDGFGASGFTLGILSILFAGVFGVIFSIVGGIFCYVQQKNKPTKIGKAGLVLNIIGFIFSLVFIFYIAPMVTQLISQASQFPIA